MAGRFRHRVPSTRRDWIRRDRLVDALSRRFDAEVTVIVAPAGFGKTVALAQAAADTRDDPTRIDVWLRCSEVDDRPEVFAASLSTSVEAAVGHQIGEPAHDLTSIAELLTSLAPAELCLILDDVHLLGDSAHVDDLLRVVPANAHLVLAGRTRPVVDLVQQELRGRVVHITQDDLAFDDEELAMLFGDDQGHHDPAARWPALAALELGSGAVGAVDYLLGEVVERMDPARRCALLALAQLDEVDDAAVAAAAGKQLTAEALLADVPLVHRSDRGTYRLHDLWRETAASVDGLEANVSAAIERIADARLPTDPVEAADLYAIADRHDGVERALYRATYQPLVVASVEQLRRLGEVASTVIDRPIAQLVAASVVHTGDEAQSADRFANTAELARTAANPAVEALALLHEFNMRWIVDPATLPDRLRQRAEVLAPEHPPARTVHATASALAALSVGDPAAAYDALAELAPTATSFDAVYYSFGMLDLGRPELVALPSDDRSVTSAAVGLGGQHVAHALWLTGTVAPELALRVGRELGTVSDEQQVSHVNVSTHAVLALVAVAAGEIDTAREHADRAGRRAATTASVAARTFARLADAVVAIEEHDEAEAARRLDRVLADAPIGAWPPRPYLSALPSVYVLAPTSRATLDRIEVGPALSTAVEVGRAVVALRERLDPSLATALPWDDESLLRAHAVPSHLVEVAAAAAAAGHDGAARVLDNLPDARRHLTRVAGGGGHVRTAGWAASRIQHLPAHPPYELRLDVMGRMSLRRDGIEVVDADWTARVRVRQLLAYLVHHRRVSRRRLVDDLWPGLDTTKALQNLRVNLTHLQRVLQPERERSEPPWFVRTTDQTIALETDGLVIDADLLDDLHRRARALDGAGRSTDATEAYRRVLELDRGEYLEEFPDADWAEVDRARLHALTLGARCRLGELLLARGEPEEAVMEATSVLRSEPLHERAARLLADGLAAQGDRAAARRTMTDILDRLAEHRLDPEPATRKIVERLGLTPDRPR